MTNTFDDLDALLHRLQLEQIPTCDRPTRIGGHPMLWCPTCDQHLRSPHHHRDD